MTGLSHYFRHRSIGWFALAVLGYAGGALLPAPLEARTAGTSGGSLGCEAEPRLTLDLEPVSMNGNSLEIGVEFTARMDAEPAAAAYEVALLDDQGFSVPAHGKAPPVVEAVADNLVPTTFYTPTALDSGFYQARVGLMVASREGEAEYVEGNVYLEYLDGDTVLLSQEEWRIRSDYMMTNAAPEAPRGKSETREERPNKNGEEG